MLLKSLWNENENILLNSNAGVSKDAMLFFPLQIPQRLNREGISTQ